MSNTRQQGTSGAGRRRNSDADPKVSNRMSNGLQEARDSIKNRRIVVDNEDDRIVRAQRAASSEIGNRNWNTAPCPELVAHRRPPCASIMVRLMDNPIPIPSGLVAKKAANNSFGSPGRPGPESSTATSTVS